MTPDWMARERQLWDAMMSTSYDVADTRRNQALIKKYKLANPGEKNIVKIRQALGLVLESEAVRDGWRCYERWIEH
jgi:hypothetical protein